MSFLGSRVYTQEFGGLEIVLAYKTTGTFYSVSKSWFEGALYTPIMSRHRYYDTTCYLHYGSL